MSRLAPYPERMTLDEFRELEMNAPPGEKWELIDGILWKMMTGGSLAHNEIVGNIAHRLRDLIEARRLPCRVYTENAKVIRDRDSLASYPDVVVRCGPREPGQTEITDPVLLVEVLSRGTAEKDRYDKAEAYYRIPTAETYLLVSQNAMDVTLLTRGPADWVRTRCYEASDRVALAPLGAEIGLDEIYAGVVEIVGRAG